jgi:type VI secretion system protein ImpI
LADDEDQLFWDMPGQQTSRTARDVGDDAGGATLRDRTQERPEPHRPQADLPRAGQPDISHEAVRAPVMPARQEEQTHPGGGAEDARRFVKTFAEAAGIPESVLAHHDVDSLAFLLGSFVRLTADDLRQLLAARFEAKRMARSSHQTQISGLDNNPLKFSPSTDDALKIMFGPPSKSYLDATRTLTTSFADIKTHQLETFAAMQAAVLELTDDFDPKKIDAATGPESTLGQLVGSRKARAWDNFVARWNAKAMRQDNGILGAFMEYFSRNYDRGK